uniref:Uncharacterized protein n=1 Tax=Virgibacillus oceani TaxID=1479511 RepID=A0A917M9T1_9BACI|nr:hypothetical protein GCM10011398_37830 [Virgibacillus oceani]
MNLAILPIKKIIFIGGLKARVDGNLTKTIVPKSPQAFIYSLQLIRQFRIHEEECYNGYKTF